MKILKHGKQMPRKFVCKLCGCEFVAEQNEYETMISGGNIIGYSIYCPDCNVEVCGSEPWEEENE